MVPWFIRAFLMTVGSWGAAKGYVTQDDIETIAGGAAALGGAIWSAYERYKVIKK